MANPYQMLLINQPTKAEIILDESHDLVVLTKIINWDRLTELSMTVRESKIRKTTGPEPHYRELLGAVALMAIKNITYRDAEDLIAHYVPARYLCNLMNSSWRPDHTTIFNFTQMLGAQGIEEINKEVLRLAIENGFADPSKMISDTTAQEAKIPYPTEVGLMSKYVEIIKKTLKKAGTKFSKVKAKIKEEYSKVKGLVRNSHLFAKTKEAKQNVGKKLYHVTKEIHEELQKTLSSGCAARSKGAKELERLTEVMEALLPQMLHFLETGFVASKKIIHLQMSELYSIVRGKAGKRVEFGLKWGINSINGFVQGLLVDEGKHCSDNRFCLAAVKIHNECFGDVPSIYGYDRGGYSKANIEKIQKMKVKHVGVAPTGKEEWAVSETMRKRIVRERAQVEGVIGSIKRSKYGFNKPDAKSKSTMISYGHRAILGFNFMKMVRETKNMELIRG
ncbi:MAG: hypothetical protein GY861_28595 [bacterium]|nr:hypothetical protein [bacterium]